MRWARSKRGEPTCCPETTFASCRPHNLCIQEASAASKCSVADGETPPLQYSGLPSLPVRVRKFCSNDFRAKFNTQWTPSKMPAPGRKKGLNGKGSQTGSQSHATEAPLRGCTLTLGEDCSPQATCTPLCRESLSLHSLPATTMDSTGCPTCLSRPCWWRQCGCMWQGLHIHPPGLTLVSRCNPSASGFWSENGDRNNPYLIGHKDSMRIHKRSLTPD